MRTLTKPRRPSLSESTLLVGLLACSSLAFAPLPLMSALGVGGAAKPSPALVAQAEAPALTYDAAAALARLQSVYDAMSDYSATFEQVHSNLAAGDERRLSGTVYFLRPGMMRWDYASPEPKHLIANGDRFWSVEPARGQYYEGSLSSSQLPTALRFLMGQGQLAEDFEVSLRDTSTEALAVLELTPHAPSPDYDHLVFSIDAASGHLLGVQVVDPLGNTNAFTFEGASFDAGFDASAFSYEPTPDMRRIETPN